MRAKREHPRSPPPLIFARSVFELADLAALTTPLEVGSPVPPGFGLTHASEYTPLVAFALAWRRDLRSPRVEGRPRGPRKASSGAFR